MHLAVAVSQRLTTLTLKSFSLKHVPARLSDSYNYSIGFKFRSFILILLYVSV